MNSLRSARTEALVSYLLLLLALQQLLPQLPYLLRSAALASVPATSLQCSKLRRRGLPLLRRVNLEGPSKVALKAIKASLVARTGLAGLPSPLLHHQAACAAPPARRGQSPSPAAYTPQALPQTRPPQASPSGAGTPPRGSQHHGDQGPAKQRTPPPQQPRCRRLASGRRGSRKGPQALAACYVCSSQTDGQQPLT
eukprot:CAMPEP_0178405788 /NCGR_PEP_ID=MMETSP0689_2-20121128/18578_1 /TAXON_ID=160604 /ORGANISM="Amphidinium massartii, Strain CS-259" /LENGTH=195 /DNA_ID=CAMNT_0020026811 /DNA_START=531 /DNA_END=1116 /DNA_ORIENTATION=-